MGKHTERAACKNLSTLPALPASIAKVYNIITSLFSRYYAYYVTTCYYNPGHHVLSASPDWSHLVGCVDPVRSQVHNLKSVIFANCFHSLDKVIQNRSSRVVEPNTYFPQLLWLLERV